MNDSLFCKGKILKDGPEIIWTLTKYYNKILFILLQN